MYDKAPNAYFSIDAHNGAILNCNKAALRMLGYSRNTLLRMKVFELYADSSKGLREAKRIFKRLKAGESIRDVELQMKQQKGGPIWVSVSVEPVRGLYGKIIESRSMVIDISERKRAEDAVLREAKINAALAGLSRALLSQKSFEDLSYLVLKEAKRFTESEIGFAGYLDPRTGYLVCPTMTHEVWDKCQVPGKTYTFEVFGGLCGQVLNTKEPILTNTPSEHPYSAGVPEGHTPIHRFLSTPAMIRDAVVGQISVANSVRDYTEQDLELIRRLTDLYAVAIQHKRSNDALQKAHDELEMRVEERTTELSKANALLQQEISERKQVEAALRGSEEALRTLSSKLLGAHEEERKRVALELHDGIGQSLSAIKYRVETALREMEEEKASRGIVSLTPIVPMVQGAVEEVRRIQKALRPSILDDLGILATVSWFCREYKSTYPAIQIENQIDIQENDVPDPLKIVIYRIFQEALNNIAKHSHAHLIWFSLKHLDGRIHLSIRDDGVGFDAEEALSEDASIRGLGLSGMRERTQISGGTFKIASRKGAGTAVLASWPISEQSP